MYALVDAARFSCKKKMQLDADFFVGTGGAHPYSRDRRGKLGALAMHRAKTHHGHYTPAAAPALHPANLSPAMQASHASTTRHRTLRGRGGHGNSIWALKLLPRSQPVLHQIRAKRHICRACASASRAVRPACTTKIRKPFHVSDHVSETVACPPLPTVPPLMQLAPFI